MENGGKSRELTCLLNCGFLQIRRGGGGRGDDDCAGEESFFVCLDDETKYDD